MWSESECHIIYIRECEISPLKKRVITVSFFATCTDNACGLFSKKQYAVTANNSHYFIFLHLIFTVTIASAGVIKR